MAREEDEDGGEKRHRNGPNERRLQQLGTPLFVVLSLLASAPVWLVKYPPLQDLPHHLASIRVLHSLHDPAFAFDHDLTVSFRQTPYMAYYVLADLLSYVLGVRLANVVLMIGYLAGTPLALWGFLRATGRDPRAALLVIPLLYNAMWILGLLPYMFGIPIFFLALALLAVDLERPSIRAGLALGGVALLLLLTHLVPFVLFGMAAVTLLPWTNPRRAVRAALPLVPAVLLLGWYTLGTRTGDVLREGASTPGPSIATCLGRAYGWTTNVLTGAADEWCFIAFALLVLAAFCLAGTREPARIGRFFFLVPMACFVLMLVTPDGRGSIMLVSQRFPILVLITLVPCVPWPQERRAGWAFTAAAAGLAVASVLVVSLSFVQVEAKELGDFDEAIAAMEPGKRVIGLVYADTQSRIVRSDAFVQFASYYQLEKGGVVEFSFFGLEHNPVSFKPGFAPPTGAPPAPDLIPTHISFAQIYPYFDYALVRGDGFHPPPGTYRLTWEGSRWAVWAREGAAAGRTGAAAATGAADVAR